MRKLLNTLFVMTPETYLSLDGENVVVNGDSDILLRVPLHTLEGILYFGYKGASPALMGACAKRGVAMHFLTPNGRYLASVSGENRGNVILRKTQYRVSDSEEDSLKIARCMIAGKIYNSRWVLERATRDYALRLDLNNLKAVSVALQQKLPNVMVAQSLDSLRGLEGDAAEMYFGQLDQLVLNQKKEFLFEGRNRRPPQDNFNALLSFAYSLLANHCAAALESVGLDSYVGFLHRDRPGRKSLALDLMEELRSLFADRFVLTLINNRIVKGKGFVKKENGAVLMTDETKKAVLSAWQERKQEQIKHPFLDEKIAWGLVPYVQALLLARYLRGDLDAYPPFMWK